MNQPDTANETGTETVADQRDVVVLICRTCKGNDWQEGQRKSGEVLAEQASFIFNPADGPDRIRLQEVECLGNCKRGCSAAILSPADWHYVFGGLDESSAGDLIAGARLMGSVAEGPMPWRGRPQSLKSGMVARIPPLGRLPEPD